MYYYDPNGKSPRRWAAIAAAAYVLLIAASFALVSFDFRKIHDKPGDTILVDFTEPPVPERPKPPVKAATEPRVHDKAAPVEQTAQVAGKDETTQTPNPKALFKMNKGGADEPDNAGNPRAPQGEDKASGDGPGLNPDGLDQLDQGLQGRGLVGNLPKPSYPGSKSGKVVIRVTVDAKGKVTGASYEPKGSTTDAAELVGAAKSAGGAPSHGGRRPRFRRRTPQGRRPGAGIYLYQRRHGAARGDARHHVVLVPQGVVPQTSRTARRTGRDPHHLRTPQERTGRVQQGDPGLFELRGRTRCHHRAGQFDRHPAAQD